MDQYQLSCFVALAESENFARAASRSNLSPSAFSRLIQRMEDELGVQLCYRNSKNSSLTPEGLHFLEYARQSLREWREVTETLRRQGNELSGELSIFATVTACYSILPAMMAEFRERHPAVSVTLRTGDAADALDMIRSSQVDCSIAPIPDHGLEDLFVEHLTVTPLVFVAPRNSRLSGLDVSADLKTFPSTNGWDSWPLILPERGLGRQRIDSWFARRGIKPNISAQVSGNEGILAMVSLGLGIGLVPELVVRNSPMAEGLEILPHLDDVPDFAVGIASRKSAATYPTVRQFMEAARRAFARA